MNTRMAIVLALALAASSGLSACVGSEAGAVVAAAGAPVVTLID